MSVNPSLRMKILIDDRDNPLIVPEMTQDEVFALLDNYYGPSTSAPAPTPAAAPTLESAPASTPDCGDEDEFAGLMEGIEETESFSQLPDSDMPMNGASPQLQSDIPFDRVSSNNATRLTGDLPMRSASPSLRSGMSPAGLPPATSPALAAGLEISEERRFQTPNMPLASQLLDGVCGNSVAPSTGGHRSSMQGEMREEEDVLSNASMESLPPFPGYHTGGNGSDDNATDSLMAEDHPQQSHDLSSSHDISEQHVATLVKHSPKQEAPASLPSLHGAQAQSGPVAPQKLKRVRELSSPLTAPIKRLRHLSPSPSSEPPSQSTQKGIKVAKLTNMEESDSSLTDVSLSALDFSIPGTTATSSGEHLAILEDLSPRESIKERKDSFAQSIRDFKEEVPSSPLAHEDPSPQKKQPKPKATPKAKRSNTAAASASPAPTKSVRVNKTSVSRSKVKNPIGASDVKGMVRAGVLGDCLKSTGPRTTRRQYKAIADAQPDPAHTAKRRHTDRVDYKE